jgi:hypothetical protein
MPRLLKAELVDSASVGFIPRTWCDTCQLDRIPGQWWDVPALSPHGHRLDHAVDHKVYVIGHRNLPRALQWPAVTIPLVPPPRLPRC